MKQRRSYLVTLVLPELRLAFLLFVFLLILPHTPALRKGLIAPPGIKRRPGVPAWLDVFPLVTSLRGRLGQGKSTSVQTPRKNFALEDSAVEALKIAPVGVLAHRVLSLSCAAVAARWIKMMMPSGEQSAEERDRQRFRGTPSVVTWCQPKVFLQGGGRTMVLDAVVEGRTISSVGCNATEFGLYLFYVQPEGPSVELRQRMLNLQDSDVKEELRGRWNTGNLILKNKSLKDLIEQKDMAKDLAAYMKRLKELDKDGTADELLDWLREAYGVEGTAVAMFDPLKTLNKTKLALKPLLEWFRNEYPYYHQKCTSCGCDSTTALGTIKATPTEQAGRAEIIHCPSCGKYTRFVRHTALSRIIGSGKGRCGEYSTLWYRVAQALGYESRWVVDWTDHVWIEVKVDGIWAHIDPCEAVFEEKMMYAGWGKQHTYIVAFSKEGPRDVTPDYCGDMQAVRERRDLQDEQFVAELAKAQTVWDAGL